MITPSHEPFPSPPYPPSPTTLKFPSSATLLPSPLPSSTRPDRCRGIDYYGLTPLTQPPTPLIPALNPPHPVPKPLVSSPKLLSSGSYPSHCSPKPLSPSLPTSLTQPPTPLIPALNPPHPGPKPLLSSS
ncbi:hypothetical protein Pcinc_039432 [Petrolisthes cinctipes]|uniref:Uncharacterized protein n=1 Tax=Petrolisthes cinctipes TaxID=88211 RepID=A0AAE1BNF7_PETCI|nr:hypothetical protein Pcinc_039432 [Petrolisthes cinctipes]